MFLKLYVYKKREARLKLIKVSQKLFKNNWGCQYIATHNNNRLSVFKSVRYLPWWRQHDKFPKLIYKNHIFMHMSSSRAIIIFCTTTNRVIAI